MILAKKVRIKPTPEQEQQLWRSAGTARWVYNWTLVRQEENYQNGGKFLPDGKLRKELTLLKQQEAYAWLYEVSNNVAKQAVKDACEAFKKMFKGQSKKPKFKSRKRSKPAFYNDTEKLKVKDGQVLLEKIGWVETSEQLHVGVKYSNPRISYDGKYWYISIAFDQKQESLLPTGEIIGIDVGLKELAVCSNGMAFKNINKSATVRKTEKRLRRLQCKASRKYDMNKEGNRFVKTCNVVKVERSIRLLHRKLTNIRTNYIHQATNAIAKTKPSVIVMEDLNVSGMMKNRHLSKAIAGQKLQEFIRQMKYKCEKIGAKFIQADKWFPSSKLCSCCGQMKSHLKLSERIYECKCGLKIDRDLNAAINLSKLAM
ncbi:IS200/IS605 family element transposase accessory protein TnpB [Paenibacillus sp. LMG 31460]|uniref:IS200/IS605 family element transposase accessory protein TnpB n=1 Tax=Paenibacillus germinis TaxID=2654979 RepID=A0ABX1ZBH4_9BACL|nr:RNA-guided endonuclease TnpB family protein [Paenibacillus germinis]NOU90705.1 IS200/IS605 family element transposase accessory protein TnpB [Paenibacillus germinis]